MNQTQEEYVASGGGKCPVCGSDSDIQGGSIQVESGTAWQECECGACHHSWTDTYNLVQYGEVKDPDGDDVDENTYEYQPE